MTSASVFPKLPDLDAQLLRVTPSDPLAPRHHNDLVDAIQNIEAVIGYPDDGTNVGLPTTFSTTLADYVNFKTTGQPNPRYPYLPLPASVWYAKSAALPAAWTLGAGVTADYTSHPGLVKLSYAGAAPALIASANIIGTAPWDIVFAARVDNPAQTQLSKYGVGVSVNGLGTDLDGGLLALSNAGGVSLQALVNGATVGGNAIPIYNPQGFAWLHFEAGSMSINATAEGAMWQRLKTVPDVRTGTPTKVCIILSTTTAPNASFYLDFLIQGNSNPPCA